MDSKKYLKEGQDMVIEIDGVEYLFDNESIKSFERGDEEIILLRLYDKEKHLVHVSQIEKSLSEKGVIDYLDKK